MITIRTLSDTALNDSNKTLTLPDPGRGAQLFSLRVEFTATATASNRALDVLYLDAAGDVVYTCEMVTAITPSDVMIVNFSPGALTVAPVDAGAEGSQHIAAGIPANGSIQVLDTAARDAAADDMILHLVYGTY
jgi:hypothetical protein